MTDQKTSNVFRFKRKRRRSSKSRAPAQMLAFPPARHRTIVRYIAAEMRRQPSRDAAEQYLISHLNVEWSRLVHIGLAEDEIERSCHAFAIAAWKIVFSGVHHEGVA